MKKTVILSFIILVLLAAVTGKGEVKAQSLPPTSEAKDIEQLFDNYARELLKISPESVAYLGINEKMGYEATKDQWDDESAEAVKKKYELKRKYHQWLEKYDKARLTPSQRRAADILTYALDRDLKGEKFQDHFYIINQMSGFHNTFTTIMVDYHTIQNINDANAYISRLEKYREKLLQISNRLKIKEKKNLLPPRHIIEKYSNILSHFIAASPESNILYTSFKERVQELDISQEVKEKLYLEAKDKIAAKVYPSYQAMIELLDGLKQKASKDAGVWRLPQGDEFYQYCLKYHTTTSMTPEEIHKTGLKEVKRIQREIKKCLLKAGFNEDLPFRNLLNYFWGWQARKNRDKLYYPPTRQGRIQALYDYQKHINDITPKLPALFSLFPKTRLLIRPVPLYKINTSGAHYEAAPLDGERGGIFYMNLANPPFKPGMKTLAIHEGIPGHHFQVSIQRESSQTRMFRHFLSFTSYIEGWALYAEKLAMENGWFEDLYSQLGYLSSELLRAVRVVLDTGIHYKRWSRGRALSYMRDNLGWSSSGEIDRYIVWPAQACAYKIGELKILELRKHAQNELKKKFNLREFHTVILEHGSVPLPILETYVNDYIMEQK